MPRPPCGPILVVDDNAEHLARLTGDLAPHGRVRPCASAHEASQVAASLHEPLLAAVLDIALGPGPDGVHVFAELRARFPHLPALVITGGAWFLTDTNARLVALGDPYWFRPRHDATPTCNRPISDVGYATGRARDHGPGSSSSSRRLG
jgi:CheY-like chemotaxis protein